MANIDLNGLKIFNNEDRQIYVDDVINNTSVSKLSKEINNIIINDDALIRNNNKLLSMVGINVSKKDYSIPPIVLHINSPGGEAYDAFGLYSQIKSYKEDVVTVGYGSVMSAAIMLFLAGKHRSCYPYTTFMIHSVSSFAWGKLKEMKDHVNESERLNDMYFNIITANTKITQQKLEEITEKKQDWFITAQEALELGIVDRIIDYNTLK